MAAAVTGVLSAAQHARALYAQFIGDSAPQQVNIPHGVRKAIEDASAAPLRRRAACVTCPLTHAPSRARAQPIKSGVVTYRLFEAATNEIFRLMGKDNFKRCVRWAVPPPEGYCVVIAHVWVSAQLQRERGVYEAA